MRITCKDDDAARAAGDLLARAGVRYEMLGPFIAPGEFTTEVITLLPLTQPPESTIEQLVALPGVSISQAHVGDGEAQ